MITAIAAVWMIAAIATVWMVAAIGAVSMIIAIASVVSGVVYVVDVDILVKGVVVEITFVDRICIE